MLMIYASGLFSGNSVTRTFGKAAATNQCLVESYYYNSLTSGILCTYTMTLYGATASIILGTGGTTFNGSLTAGQIYCTVIDNIANSNGLWIGYNSSQGTSTQPALRVYDNSTARTVLLEVDQAGTSSGTNSVNFFPSNGPTTITGNKTYTSGTLPGPNNNIWWNQSSGQGEMCFGNGFSTGTNNAFAFYNSSLTKLFSINSLGGATTNTTLNVGTTATIGGGIFVTGGVTAGAVCFIGTSATILGGLGNGAMNFGTNTSNNNQWCTFYNSSNAAIGSIFQNSLSGTTFSTTSDYRLKSNERPIAHASSRLMKLKPYKFKWKDSGEEDEGFFAHELQEVFPYAVGGEKDGEKMQMVDYGRITPLLTAAMQEQQVQIEALMHRIRELENKLV